MMRKNHQQKENTTYIDGFTVLFFDGMSKERKKYKRDKVQSVKDWKNTKKSKIQIAFLDVMEKNKKIQKYKVYGFGWLWAISTIQWKFRNSGLVLGRK